MKVNFNQEPITIYEQRAIEQENVRFIYKVLAISSLVILVSSGTMFFVPEKAGWSLFLCTPLGLGLILYFAPQLFSYADKDQLFRKAPDSLLDKLRVALEANNKLLSDEERIYLNQVVTQGRKLHLKEALELQRVIEEREAEGVTIESTVEENEFMELFV